MYLLISVETRGVINRAHGARDRDIAVLERLAHDFQNITPELWQLVEKQDPIAERIDRPVVVLKVSGLRLETGPHGWVP